MKYFDKNNKEIKEGMFLKHDNGDVEEVYISDSGDLGFMATRESHISKRMSVELYPLYEFNLEEWVIEDNEI